MELSKEFIENMIREVIREELTGKAEPPRQIDASGVISINPKGMKLEKFPFESERVYLKDVLSLDESPRLGCGIMEMEKTKLDWTLKYGEVDYIMEGTLEIIIDGRKVTASEGEILFIPKNSTITFSAPEKTRFMYVVYPANWSEQ